MKRLLLAALGTVLVAAGVVLAGVLVLHLTRPDYPPFVPSDGSPAILTPTGDDGTPCDRWPFEPHNNDPQNQYQWEVRKEFLRNGGRHPVPGCAATDY